MFERVISPPRRDWPALPTKLTCGEELVADWFDQRLPAGWEIYLQPRINGLQPDIVLLHPEIGVAVYEVKDWNPEASRYFVDKGILKAWYPGQSKAVAVDEKANPFLRVRDYKRYISKICTNAIPGIAGYGRITAGVICTLGFSRFWKDLAEPF